MILLVHIEKISGILIYFNNRLYITVENSNTELRSSAFIRTLVLNFTVSHEAIKDQLMHFLANIVEHDIELNKARQIKENAENRIAKDKKENEILDHIKRLGTKLLDDQTLINTLSEYRSISDQLDSKLRVAKVISINKKI